MSQGIFTCSSLILKYCSSAYLIGRLTCPCEQISVSISSYRVPVAFFAYISTPKRCVLLCVGFFSPLKTALISVYPIIPLYFPSQPLLLLISYCIFILLFVLPLRECKIHECGSRYVLFTFESPTL